MDGTRTLQVLVYIRYLFARWIFWKFISPAYSQASGVFAPYRAHIVKKRKSNTTVANCNWSRTSRMRKLPNRKIKSFPPATPYTLTRYIMWKSLDFTLLIARWHRPHCTHHWTLLYATSLARFAAPGLVINAMPLQTTAVSSTNAHSGKFSSGGSSTTSRPSSRNKLKINRKH